jgi:hypothetical protein
MGVSFARTPSHASHTSLTLPVPGGPCHSVRVLASAASMAEPWL